jgi:FAD binding domain-containing protein/aromatic ring hydroxylase-like protein
MPPTGGFGGNTGIQDAHNLAWKLDHVLRGAAGPGLLDTYDCERRPVAEATLAQALARLQAWFKDPSDKLPPAEKIVDDDAVIFGHRYLSGALVAEPDSSAEAFEDPRAPSGRPGSRAPQVIVERAGERLSTIDLCAGRWVLLVGPGGSAWLDATDRIPAAADFRLQRYRFGPQGDLRDVEDRWSCAYSVPADGVVLIRPDGFIAWGDELRRSPRASSATSWSTSASVIRERASMDCGANLRLAPQPASSAVHWLSTGGVGPLRSSARASLRKRRASAHLSSSSSEARSRPSFSRCSGAISSTSRRPRAVRRTSIPRPSTGSGRRSINPSCSRRSDSSRWRQRTRALDSDATLTRRPTLPAPPGDARATTLGRSP